MWGTTKGVSDAGLRVFIPSRPALWVGLRHLYSGQKRILGSIKPLGVYGGEWGEERARRWGLAGWAPSPPSASLCSSASGARTPSGEARTLPFPHLEKLPPYGSPAGPSLASRWEDSRFLAARTRACNPSCGIRSTGARQRGQERGQEHPSLEARPAGSWHEHTF